MLVAKYPIYVEYPHPMSLEVSFSGGPLPTVLVDDDGHFYMHSSATNIYYPVRYDEAWEDFYPEHYHDQDRHCGHHPFFNFFPSDTVQIERMKVGLQSGSRIPPYAGCPPDVGYIADEPNEVYISEYYDHYYAVDGSYCPICITVEECF